VLKTQPSIADTFHWEKWVGGSYGIEGVRDGLTEAH
jgi:hypothetical protein